MKYVGQRVCVCHLQNVNKSVDYFCLFRQEGPPRYKSMFIESFKEFMHSPKKKNNTILWA